MLEQEICTNTEENVFTTTWVAHWTVMIESSTIHAKKTQYSVTNGWGYTTHNKVCLSRDTAPDKLPANRAILSANWAILYGSQIQQDRKYEGDVIVD